MNFKQTNVTYFGKQCLIVCFLLFSLQALRCGGGQSKRIPVGSQKGLAHKMTAYPISEFKRNLDNQKDISQISGDILHTTLNTSSRDKLDRIKAITARIKISSFQKHSGSFPNAFDKSGQTPLMVAIRSRDPQIITELINCPSIEINSKNSKTGATPLHYLAQYCKSKNMINLNKSFIRKLEFDDLFVKDRSNRTPLYFSARFKNKSVCDALIQRVRENFKGNGNNLSTCLKEKFLEKDDKNTSVLCRMFIPNHRMGAKISRMAHIPMSRDGMDMFISTHQQLSNLLSPSDIKYLNEKLQDEVSGLIASKKIPNKTGDQLLRLLKGDDTAKNDLKNQLADMSEDSQDSDSDEE